MHFCHFETWLKYHSNKTERKDASAERSKMNQSLKYKANLPSYTAANPFPTQLLLLRNSIHILLSVEVRTSGTLSPQNLPERNKRIEVPKYDSMLSLFSMPATNYKYTKAGLFHISITGKKRNNPTLILT